MYDIESILDEAAKQLGVDRDEIEWYSWPQTFPTASGPFGGVSGQMITSFQVFAFTSPKGRIKVCCGKWRKWKQWGGRIDEQW